MVYAYGYGIRCARFWKLPLKVSLGEECGVTLDAGYYTTPGSLDDCLPDVSRLVYNLTDSDQAVAYHFEGSTEDVGPVAFVRGDRVVFHACVPQAIVTQFGVDEEPLIVLEYVESAATTLVCRDRYSHSVAEFLVEDGRAYGYAEVVAFSPATNQVLTAPKHLFRRVP